MHRFSRRTALLALAAGGAACVGSPPLRVAPAGPGTLPLHVVARDWHTDIGLPVAALRGPLRQVGQDFPGATHLLFGFGERAYWTRPNPSFADMLLALLPGPGVVLVTGLRTDPAAAFGDALALAVTPDGTDRLCAFLWATLEQDAEGLPRLLTRGPYPGSLFYASDRGYAAHYTCNTWTAEGLRIAGLPLDPSGILFAGQLMARLRRLAG
jgi:Protein of unknown function (DUF2459)